MFKEVVHSWDGFGDVELGMELHLGIMLSHRLG